MLPSESRGNNMDAGQTIDMLQRRIGGHYTRGELREEIRTAVNEIYSLAGTRFGRRNTPTILPTTAGVLEYTITGRLVTSLYTVDRTLSTYPPEDRETISSYGRKQSGNILHERQELTFECKESNDPEENTCTVFFDYPFDPGTTTQKYYMEVYDWPLQITADSQIVPLPEAWITTLLYYVVKKRIEESAYGVDIYSTPEVVRMTNQLRAQQVNRPRATTNKIQMRF